MKFQTYFKTAFALLALSATSAMAVPYTIEATGIPAHLSQGSYQASFNGSSLLPQGPFVINSLQFSFVFMDDEDTVVYSPQATEYSTPEVTRTTSTDKKTVHEITTLDATMPRTGLGEQESVKLSFGGVSFDGVNTDVGATFTLPTGTTTSTKPTVYQWSGSGASCTSTQWGNKSGTSICQKIQRSTVTNYYTRIDTTKEYTGQVTFDGSLMDYSSLRKSLILTKALNFSLEVLGDIDLVSATLDLDISLPSSNNTVDVPEPGSVLLFGIALLGMAGIRRKQRR